MSNNNPDNGLQTVQQGRANGYTFNGKWRAIGPVTIDEFEVALAKSVPVKDAWINPNCNDVKHETEHIYVTNITGIDIGVSYNMTPLDQSLSNEREFVPELGGYPLKHGSTIALKTLGTYFHFGFAERTLDDSFRSYFQTAAGITLNHIRGKLFNIIRSLETGDLAITPGQSAGVGFNEAVFVNGTNEHIIVNLHKYNMKSDAQDEENIQRNDRSYDPGPQVLDHVTLTPGFKWRIAPQSTFYTIREVQLLNARARISHSQLLGLFPNDKDYVEGPRVVNARTSNYVIFYALDKSGNGHGVQIYKYEDIKPVNEANAVTRVLDVRQ